MTASAAQRAIRKLGNREKAKFLLRFFKTAPGEYSHGDTFVGVVVPDTRKVAKEFKDLTLSELHKLLRSHVHEDRLLALIILETRFEKVKDPKEHERMHRFYVKNFSRINNWDLVDSSARALVGGYFRRYRTKAQALTQLKRWARSSHLWTRRISMIATFDFIRNGQFDLTWAIARELLRDEEDLIHKASGWMLREAGQKDLAGLRRFLKRHAHEMPRTMLRYSIEKLSPAERRKWMTA